MRGRLLVALLGGACLLVIWSLVGWSQVIDSDACEKACQEQHDACVTACGEQTDPVECEGRCEDRLGDCLARCRFAPTEPE